MNRRNDGRSNRARRRGVAALELALFLPGLLLLLFGCVDLGRFAHTSHAVSNAARAGAALGSNHPVVDGVWTLSQAKIADAVREELHELGGYNPAKLTVTSAVDTVSDAPLWRVTVTVTYPFRTVIPWPGLPAEIALTRTVVMRGVR